MRSCPVDNVIGAFVLLTNVRSASCKQSLPVSPILAELQFPRRSNVLHLNQREDEIRNPSPILPTANR